MPERFMRGIEALNGIVWGPVGLGPLFGTGLLLTVRTDWTEIAGERKPGLRLALSPTALGNGYSALWGGEVRKGGAYEVSGTGAAVSDPAGTAAG